EAVFPVCPVQVVANFRNGDGPRLTSIVLEWIADQARREDVRCRGSEVHWGVKDLRGHSGVNLVGEILRDKPCFTYNPRPVVNQVADLRGWIAGKLRQTCRVGVVIFKPIQLQTSEQFVLRSDVEIQATCVNVLSAMYWCVKDESRSVQAVAQRRIVSGRIPRSQERDERIICSRVLWVDSLQ